MHKLISPRAVSFFTLGAVAVLPFAIGTGACGGDDNKNPKPPQNPSASSATATQSVIATPSATVTASETPIGSATTTAPEPQGSKYTSKKATQKADKAWLDCMQAYVPKCASTSADVALEAKSCEAATHMHLLGRTLTGQGTYESVPAKFPFKAKAGKCYRVYAESECVIGRDKKPDTKIKDLDMQVKDSANELAGEDATDDSSPVVQEDGAVCFNADDDAVVSVSIGAGKGKFAVQIWTDE